MESTFANFIVMLYSPHRCCHWRSRSPSLL